MPRELRWALMDFSDWVFVKKEWPETRPWPSGEQTCLCHYGQHVTAVLFPCQPSKGLERKVNCKKSLTMKCGWPGSNCQWKALLTTMDYNSSIRWAHRCRCDDNNVTLMYMQPHFYHVRQVEPCHRLCKVAGCSSSISKVLALCLNNDNNDTNINLQNRRLAFRFNACQNSTVGF